MSEDGKRTNQACKTIRDPVHGNISVPEWCVRIMDTPQFQRLRRIRQIGFASLVYPGANHTRFEHSLGVMHIVLKLSKKMECNEKTKMECIAAALLHDVGHAPFSHSSERILEKYLRMGHENVMPILRGSEVHDILKEEGLSLRKVSEIIKGPSIVSGDIDADRMDYLVRDSHYTGVAYGVFDLMRLVERIKFEGINPIIEGRALRAAEALLLSRFMMYPTVYHHHVCRIARKMYERAIELCIEDGFDPRKLLEMDDYEMVVFLRNQSGFVKELIDRLDSRRLFKRAIYVNRQRIHSEKVDVKRAEAEIAEEAGVDEKYVIVDMPFEEEAKELRAVVEINGEKKRLEEVSPLVKSLRDAEKNSLMVGVYTDKNFIDKVAKAAISYFSIEKSHVQRRLDEVLPIW